MLEIRHVDLRFRRSGRIVHANIAGNSDDGHPLRSIEAAFDLFSERIGIGKRSLRETFADDRHERRIESVRVVEVSPLDNRNGQRLEIIRRNDWKARLRRGNPGFIRAGSGGEPSIEPPRRITSFKRRNSEGKVIQSNDSSYKAPEGRISIPDEHRFPV